MSCLRLSELHVLEPGVGIVNPVRRTWSEGVYKLFERDPNLAAPTFEEQQSIFSNESMIRLRAAVDRAIDDGTPYELDLELRVPSRALDGQPHAAKLRAISMASLLGCGERFRKLRNASGQKNKSER